jgi:hypothetical protein
MVIFCLRPRCVATSAGCEFICAAYLLQSMSKRGMSPSLKHRRMSPSHAYGVPSSDFTCSMSLGVDAINECVSPYATSMPMLHSWGTFLGALTVVAAGH